MTSNDIKKGMKLVLRSGFSGIMADNKKGNIRMVDVQGLCGREIGSCYVWDIAKVWDENNVPHKVELNSKQCKAMNLIKGVFR